MVAGQEINFPGRLGGWVGGGEELEIRFSSGQRKQELGFGLSLAISIMEIESKENVVRSFSGLNQTDTTQNTQGRNQ